MIALIIAVFILLIAAAFSESFYYAFKKFKIGSAFLSFATVLITILLSMTVDITDFLDALLLFTLILIIQTSKYIVVRLIEPLDQHDPQQQKTVLGYTIFLSMYPLIYFMFYFFIF
jgi:hypothetical protein